MKPCQTIVTSTVCLAIIIWGTMLINRLVPDPHYQEPNAVDQYVECLRRATPTDDKKAVEDTCRALAGVAEEE